jgi:hypothetical protein
MPKVKPVARTNTVKIAPRLRHDRPNLTRGLPPVHQLDLAKVKANAANRGRSPSLSVPSIARPNVANIVRTPKLTSPKLGRQIPIGNLATARNILPNPSGVKQNGPASQAGAQQNPSLPRLPAPPVDDNLADAITVTGGRHDWWQAFEQWSDLANAGHGNFQPEFFPGRGRDRPEIDLNPVGPDRSDESGERGIGPRGSPGDALANSPFGNPTGKVADGWVRLGGSDGVRVDTDGDGREDATMSSETWSDGQGTTSHETLTIYDDGRHNSTQTISDGRNTDVYLDWSSGAGGTGKHIHTRNGEWVNHVNLTDPIVITAGEDTGEDTDEDESDEKGSDNPEDSQPGAEGTARPRGGANDVRCGWWGCTDGGVSTPARTNPGHADSEGSIPVGGSTGTGAVTDPTPMDGTTGSSGGGSDDPAPGGNPGDPDGPGT